ncbi:hypothetical protein BCR37DRAFT_395963 [Protomyces lactucae-debilis]|uniref:Uncharacterized protein n=1 Tax=Protomyces lactucae-debilis TaxID=2754530 RepID=A0A1Y2EPJ2_PROLT|nr:uncharacterized protein BCR37DRAFT_395963 [Protomyces lactucae-debilis]ORY73459.1 hypothetical protein BCR37DRAFT_395963 [Protomyces lactucae-debilis]
MSIHALDTLSPDLSLVSSAQYLRAWRKFVERIPRFLGETVAVDALPLASFQLSTLKAEYLNQVPGSKLISTVKEVKFSDILAEFLFPRHERPALDKEQRAKRINEIYAQRPTFDETEFTVGDLKAFFRRIMPEVQADRFEFLYAGRNLWIPDSFTILSVWTDPTRYTAYASDISLSLGLSLLPLRMAIGGEHSAFVKHYAQYGRSTGSSDTDQCLVPTNSRCQPCDRSELCTPQVLWSPQHAAAWHKYVVRDSRFAKDPISYRNFVERATLTFIDSTGAPYQRSAESPLHELCGDVGYTKLGEMFLVPDLSASREWRANAINDLYAARPDFDETQFSVDDLITVVMRAVPNHRVEVVHPRHHLPFPGPMPLCSVQQGLMKENRARGFFGRFESVLLTIRIDTAQSQAEMQQGVSDETTKHERIHDDVVPAQASDRTSASAAERLSMTNTLRHRAMAAI